MSQLFTPVDLRGLTVRNRVWVSPMCQYTATDGVPNDWHLVHLGSLARGGAGLVFTEATAVSPEGRISPEDTGLWNDEQQEAWTRIVDFLHSQGAAAGLQVAHAGRKASTWAPWRGKGSVPVDAGGWETVAPSAVAFPGYAEPRAMTTADIDQFVDDVVATSRRALAAGFDTLEIHAAHGYLLHEFASPLSNQRTDSYGGSFANRTRLHLRVVDAVRDVIPATMPLVVRISATDWLDGGWDGDDSVRLAGLLREHGVDLVDTSSGGNAPAEIPVGPGYQVDLAARLRSEAGIAVGSVGMITEPAQAEKILANGQADVVLLARELLRDPNWPLHAAEELGDSGEPAVRWPEQYQRAAPPSR